MKKMIVGLMCVMLMVVMVGASFAESWFDGMNTDHLLWKNEEAKASPAIWYAWDEPEWSYMPFFRYMEDWFKPVKLPIYELDFELGEPVYL
jgi:hypothetical protein